jgi:hypothetical protein
MTDLFGNIAEGVRGSRRGGALDDQLGTAADSVRADGNVPPPERATEAAAVEQYQVRIVFIGTLPIEDDPLGPASLAVG